MKDSVSLFSCTRDVTVNGGEIYAVGYGSQSVKLTFWNRKAQPSVSACDAIARDLEHFIFKVNIYVSNAKSYHSTAATYQLSLKFELHTV
jgi:hypothetical protein